MTQMKSDGGTTRHETTLDLADVSEGDRVDPALIPRSPTIDVGEPVWKHVSQSPETDAEDDRTFGVRLVAHGYRDQYQDVQAALVYDPEADLFARLTGHSSSGAMNQLERDYKVRAIGQDIDIVDQWDVDIPDLEDFDQTAEEFVEEWATILFDNVRYGDQPGDELRDFEDQKFTLADYDGRRARVHYELV